MRSEATYHCPACGGPQTQTTRGTCDYCEAPRVPVGTPDPRTALVCGGCQALVGGGASFCPHCGDPMAETSRERTDLQCPHCGDKAPPMTRWGLAPTKARPGGYQVDGCPYCGGVWLEAVTLKAMLAEAAELVGKVSVAEAKVARKVVAEAHAPVTYRRCPVCQDMMARKNFERVSGIILDTCIDHGTYFDSGELQDVLKFVRSGGLVLAQQKRAAMEAHLTAQEAEARKAPTTMSGPTGGEAKAMMMMGMTQQPSVLTRGVGELALALLRWGATWAWRAAKTVADARHR